MKLLKYFICIILFFPACETVVTLEIPEHESKLVVYGYFDPAFEELRVEVNNSVGILSTADPEPINDAQVEFLKDGQSIGFFNITNNEGRYKLEHQLSLNPNDNYELKISANNYTSVSATQMMLEQPEITHAEETGRTLPEEFNEGDFKEYRITINDNSDKENFYILQYIKYDTIEQKYNKLNMYSESVDVERGLRKELIFRDIILAGNNYEINVICEDLAHVLETNEIGGFRLLNVSEDRFLYAKSFKDAKDAEDNPFAEPVTVHTNIENGLGIFSLERRFEIFLN